MGLAHRRSRLVVSTSGEEIENDIIEFVRIFHGGQVPSTGYHGEFGPRNVSRHFLHHRCGSVAVVFSRQH